MKSATKVNPMRYTEFRDTIKQALLLHPDGMTWKELQTNLKLPYRQTCPEWLGSLEKEIGLQRKVKRGNAYIWKLVKS